MKVGGGYKLIDPSPNYQQELAKCLRYQRVDGTGLVGHVQDGSILFSYPFPVEMAKKPTPKLLQTDIYFNVFTNDVHATNLSFSLYNADKNGLSYILIDGNFSPALPADGSAIRFNNVGGLIFQDANL